MIHQALWQAPGQVARKVAVKLYKGQMTSDGSPLHEMHACITAGRHPNLIEVLGQVAGHPEQQAGLVMALIEPSYRNLAGLPSLASCSRDVYADELRLSAPAALRIAHGIASVAAHLHRQGITHGDLYGHNILCDDQGDCLLGDFWRGVVPRHHGQRANPRTATHRSAGLRDFAGGIAGADRTGAQR
nr:hypothetical protein GCM10020185_03880 [Pseudomonas brassicacearum subsp. brassicacearum]